MNKYLIPICDIQNSRVWLQVITARSTNECKDKLMNLLINKFDLDYSDTFEEFVTNADNNDILIGNIKDIEEL